MNGIQNVKRARKNRHNEMDGVLDKGAAFSAAAVVWPWRPWVSSIGL
jgi:hypothetical protein